MSYFPCDIPYMSDEELKENGIHIPKDITDTNVRKTKYIEHQAVIDALEKVAGLFPYKIPGNADTYSPYNEAWNDAIGRAEMEMESLEPADVMRVIHGHWIYKHGEMCCSRCNERILNIMHWGCLNYCPNCGLIMDGKEGERRKPGNV